MLVFSSLSKDLCNDEFEINDRMNWMQYYFLFFVFIDTVLNGIILLPYEMHFAMKIIITRKIECFFVL